MGPVEIRPGDERELTLWRVVCELARALPQGSWTLVGAQMVFLIAYERGLPIGRTSGDVDLIMDVRALTRATEDASTTLMRLGFKLDPPSMDGRAHRFRRGEAVVDILGPDGIGERASLMTIAPARTIAVAGGSQALRRTRLVSIEVGGTSAEVPCPTALGAMLLKARAVDVAEDPDKHRADLALLAAAIDDPRTLRVEMRASERRWLRRRRELLVADHPAWRSVPNAEDARVALEILME